MEPITLTFLGTGSSIPTRKRNHQAVLISLAEENILFDCGEGTQRQFKYAELSPYKLTKIFLTHWHGDHTLGLLGLLQTLTMLEYKKELKIYGPPGTKRYFYLLSEFIKGFGYGKIDISIEEISNTLLDFGSFQIETLSLNHNTPTNGYSLILKDKIRLDKKKIAKLKLPNSPLLRDLQQGKSIKFNGKTISPKQVCYEEKGKKISYILDTAETNNIEKLAKDSDVLIIESTFLEENKETKEIAAMKKHLTVQQAAKIAKKAKVKSLYLTHISQKFENKTDLILKEAKKIFKNTKVPNDLDVVEI